MRAVDSYGQYKESAQTLWLDDLFKDIHQGFCILADRVGRMDKQRARQANDSRMRRGQIALIAG